MVGGDADVCRRLEPIFLTLAPPDGYLRVGGHGAGHYVKMVHNGIEYGLMQAYAEGFELMHASAVRASTSPKIASLWMHGSVVRSWLLELTARALADDPRARRASKGYVEDSGEGRWTLHEAIERGVPLPVLTAALFTRFRSRERQSVRRAAAGRAAPAVRRPRRAVPAPTLRRRPTERPPHRSPSSSSAAPAISRIASCCRRSTTCTSTASCPPRIRRSSASAARR